MYPKALACLPIASATLDMSPGSKVLAMASGDGKAVAPGAMSPPAASSSIMAGSLAVDLLTRNSWSLLNSLAIWALSRNAPFP